jgi:hypothetical protein
MSVYPATGTGALGFAGAGSGAVSPTFIGPSASSGVVTYTVGVPPYIPTILTPAEQSVVDLTTQAVSWTYSSPTGLPQASYALMVLVGGLTTWQWFDAATNSLVATETFNPLTTQSVVPGSPVLQNGNTYSLAVAVKDSSGTASAYSATTVVTGSPTPVVVPTGPSGTLTAGAQTLQWLNQQVTVVASWQVVLYTLTQTQASGFSPGASPWVYNSGVVLGSSNSAPLPAVGVGSYVAYIQITAQLGNSSAWTSWDLTYSYTAPAQPTLTATYEAATQTVNLTLTGADTGSLLGQTSGSVYRSLDGGSTWSVVSTFDQVPLPATSESATEVDNTPAGSDGVPTSIEYYGVVIGPNNTLSPRSGTVSVTPTSPPSTMGVDQPGWFFRYGASYASQVTPRITTFDQSQPQRAGAHEILGSGIYIYTYDVVGGRTLDFTAVTETDAEWTALRAWLQAGTAGINTYIVNTDGLVGFFSLVVGSYKSTILMGTSIRTITFSVIETGYLPSEGAGT